MKQNRIIKKSFLKLFVLAGMVSFANISLATAQQASESSTKEVAMPTIILNNGDKIPQLGFGLWQLNKEEAVRSVKIAIAEGYRLFDTAQYYQNEGETYQAIKESGIARKDVYITTKVWPTHMRNGTVRESLDKSLELLGGEYIDLVLIHWPADEFNKPTWQIMEEYVDKGKIKSIGVSNFSPEQLKELMSYARIKPVVNQIEIHPYRNQLRNAELNKELGVAVETWSPLGSGKVLQDQTLTKLANKYNKSVAQIILRWNIQRGLITIPRSRNKDHIAENINVFNFQLADKDMEIINNLNRS